ncbi:MAG: hypothetical protein CFE32_15300 [Alphaproteobacteria bacterium PA3]|nr:MAG: hypothetical protein CFE32_15300 [Alphaproteobacteria bacterium PA3]
MTTAYRQYRGLYGEAVRVPEATIATPSRLHGRGPFPFSAIASRLGSDRDKFAALALRARWIDDVRRAPRYRQTTAQLGRA